MPNKYDAGDLRLAEKIVNLIDPTMQWATMERTVAVLIAEYRRSAFPPPAEDARHIAHLIMGSAVYNDGTELAEEQWLQMKEHNAQWIERFAESRVEPWREALRRALADFARNDWGTELPSESEAWVHKARTLLSDSPAKEDAR